MEIQVKIKQYGEFQNPSFNVEVETENLEDTFEKSNKVKVVGNTILQEGPYFIKVDKEFILTNYRNGYFVLTPQEEEKFIYKAAKKDIRKVKDIIKNSKSNNVNVMTLVRSDFNDELSTNVGFGSQDLKLSKKLVMDYLSSKYDMVVTPKSMNMKNFSAEVVVVKNGKKFDLAAN